MRDGTDRLSLQAIFDHITKRNPSSVNGQGVGKVLRGSMIANGTNSSIQTIDRSYVKAVTKTLPEWMP
jgi:hypothetical protein